MPVSRWEHINRVDYPTTRFAIAIINKTGRTKTVGQKKRVWVFPLIAYHPVMVGGTGTDPVFLGLQPSASTKFANHP